MSRIIAVIMLLCSFTLPSLCYAWTDDIGVIAHLEDCPDYYQYLNHYNYRLWYANHKYGIQDMYISADDAVIVDMWNGHVSNIYICKPGYKTNKGIEVGMSLTDVAMKYGPYDLSKNISYELEKNNSVGRIMTLPSDYAGGNYAGYMEVVYVSAQNGGLSFVIDKYTRIVKLIRYKRNRKGSTWALHDIKEYNLLPYLR